MIEGGGGGLCMVSVLWAVETKLWGEKITYLLILLIFDNFQKFSLPLPR